MNEQELRSLVRAAVARHFGNGPPHGIETVGLRSSGWSSSPRDTAGVEAVPLPVLSSHALYTGLVNIGDACVIEPVVSCDHCGYCKAHGY